MLNGQCSGPIKETSGKGLALRCSAVAVGLILTVPVIDGQVIWALRVEPARSQLDSI